MILDEDHISGLLVIIGIVSVIMAIAFAIHMNTGEKSDFKECMNECRASYAYKGDGYQGIENEEYLKECSDKCFELPGEITADDYEY